MSIVGFTVGRVGGVYVWSSSLTSLMAEGIVVEGKTLDRLEGEVTCAVCQEFYTEPKILPCLHYYCKTCVLKIAGAGKSFSCPECRFKTTLPEGGVDGLKEAFFVNRLQSTVTTMKKVHGKVETKCELCSAMGTAEAFCRQCAMFICSECVEIHKRLKTHTSHEVAFLEDLKLGQAKPPVMRESGTDPKCKHHEEPLVLYCFSCSSLICRDCTVKDHRDHNFEFCKKAVINTKKDILARMKPIRQHKTDFDAAIKEVQAVTKALELHEGTMTNNIRVSFRKLHEVLNQREKELLEEVTQLTMKKKQNLSAQEKALTLVRAEVQSIMDFTERFVDHCTDSEVVNMQSEIMNKLDWRSDNNKLELVEEVDFSVKIDCDQFQQELRKQAVVIQLPADPAKCTVSISDKQVLSTKTAKLTVRRSDGTIVRKRCKVAGVLMTNYKEQICVVDGPVRGVYNIHYNIRSCLPSKLSISVDGQKIAGSPFYISGFV